MPLKTKERDKAKMGRPRVSIAFPAELERE
jgi:hypothetical protein